MEEKGNASSETPLLIKNDWKPVFFYHFFDLCPVNTDNVRNGVRVDSEIWKMLISDEFCIHSYIIHQYQSVFLPYILIVPFSWNRSLKIGQLRPSFRGWKRRDMKIYFENGKNIIFGLSENQNRFSLALFNLELRLFKKVCYFENSWIFTKILHIIC